MLSTVYVACLLAASAAASPAPLNARAFSSYSQDAAQSDQSHDLRASSGPFGSSMSQADSQSASSRHNSGSDYNSGAGFGGGYGGISYGGNAGFGNFGGSGYNAMSADSASANSYNSANAYNAGGFGGYGSGSSSFSSSQQSSSSSSVSSGFQSLNGMIGGIQSQLAAGQLTQAVAFQQCQQLAQSFQAVLAQANRCDSCFQDPGQFGGVASSTMSSFTNFMSQLQSTFGGNAFGQIASPFSSLSSSFQQFFQKSSSSSSFSSTNIVPQNFGPIMQGVMPSLMPTIQQLNGNNFNAGSASSSSSLSSSQQSSSTSSVSSGFQSLNGMIGGIQSQLVAGQMTQAIAYQQCQQLAQSFQTVLAQANGCDACFNNAAQFGTAASSTMTSFTNFMSQLQSTFGGSAFSQIASPFSNLSTSFRSFFQKSSSSSSFSSASVVPQNFGSVMQGVMPSVMPIVQQIAFQKK